MTKAAKKIADAELDALDAELTGDPAPKTAEQLYEAFVARKRSYQAQPSFEQLKPEERLDWEATAAEANT